MIGTSLRLGTNESSVQSTKRIFALPTRRKFDSANKQIPNTTSSVPASNAGTSQSTSSASNGRLIDKIHLIADGSGRNSHIPKVWSGYAYTDRFEYEFGSQGQTLKADIKFAHECRNGSPKDHLDKLVQEKMAKGYTFKK